MTKIILSGYSGKMGQVIARLAEQEDRVSIVAGFDIQVPLKSPCPVFANPRDCDVKADVIIDFSHPSCLEGLLQYAKATQTPIVVATTGLSPEQLDSLREVSEEIPVFFSANMSLGVNLMMDLVCRAARVLSESFDIEVIEKHHNQKIDAPSGTALAIADAMRQVLPEVYDYQYDRHAVRQKRPKKEIGLHAVRGGTIVGEHTVLFAGQDELIEVKHTALSKEVFGAGALKAAQYLSAKAPGFYSMEDLVNGR